MILILNSGKNKHIERNDKRGARRPEFQGI